MHPPARIGITLGDVNGIGPEVAVRAVCARSPARARWVLIGSRAAIDAECRNAARAPFPAWDPSRPPPRRVAAWDPSPDLAPAPRPGRVAADASRAAVAWIRAGVRACLDGRLDALVTGPICKEGLKAAGLSMPGHTEFLADLTGTRRFAMMLVGGPLRVLLATRHIPLRDVPGALTPKAVRMAVELAAEALPWLGVENGRIGVAGLNPHAGDGGAIGDEEQTVLAPVLRALSRRVPRLEGPIPADVIFHRALRGDLDAVVALYHDQGLAPLKMIAFDRGVNVTLGLPIVRTSPDHGTAFDIAGRGIADASSMRAALRMAVELAGRPNPWARPS
jgi:4-hydroxythreonine-4-phosphate dehydrogenase